MRNKNLSANQALIIDDFYLKVFLMKIFYFKCDLLNKNLLATT